MRESPEGFAMPVGARYLSIMNSPGNSNVRNSRMENEITVEIPDWLPGADKVRRGLSDLAANSTSEESLMVQIGAPRLRRLGFVIPERRPETPSPEAELYARLSATGQDSAHSRYNSLIRLLVSFERAAESGAR